MRSGVRITYDPEGDILFVTFGAPVPSTGYQVADQILLRVHPESRAATGLTILNFALHGRSQRPIRLSGLDELGTATDVLPILRSAPVNRFLRVSEDEAGLHAVILQPALAEALAA